MADNVAITAGSGTTIAADDIGGVLHQRVKISQGADGSATDVSSAAPLQVTLANTGVNTNKLLVTPDLPSGAATSAKQDTIIGHVDGLEALATTIDADTSNISAKIDTVASDTTAILADTAAIETATEAIQAAVEGTIAVSNSALTELAAAINTDKVDVNIASGNITGFATSAKQDTIISHVDGLEALATTIDADTSNISSKIDTVAGDTTSIQTAVETLDDIVLAEDAAHQSGDKGVMALAVRQDSQSDFGADGDYVPLSVNDSGELRIAGTISADGLATEAKQDTIIGHVDGIETLLTTIESNQLADSHNVTVDNGSGASAVNIQDGGNTITVDGTVAVTNAGLTALNGAISGSEVQVDVLTMPTVTVTATNLDVQSGGADLATSTQAAAIQTAVETIDNAISGSEMQVDVVAALPAGTNAIGKLAANSGVDIGDVDVTSISAGTNAIGNVGLIGRTTGGLTIFRSIDIDETEEDVKTSAGQLFSISAFNKTAAPLYLKFYNATAANVTVGSTTPVMTFVVPANADSDGAGFVHSTDIGYAFSTAISVACTTGVADSDTGAPGANDCVINLGYM